MKQHTNPSRPRKNLQYSLRLKKCQMHQKIAKLEELRRPEISWRQ
jgi:hypothetical protein